MINMGEIQTPFLGFEIGSKAKSGWVVTTLSESVYLDGREAATLVSLVRALQKPIRVY